MVKTYVISDTLLLDQDIRRTSEALKIIKELKTRGDNIVILSNRPSMCMKPLCGQVDELGTVSYVYKPECNIKGNGLDVRVLSNNEVIVNDNIEYDYNIFGNGIAIFNQNDDTIYQGKFIDQTILDKMVEVFESRGYKPANYCFNKGDNVYKFFRPDNGAIEPSDNTYGMQCGAVSEEFDSQTIKAIQIATGSIIGYILNGKPCFYNTATNKMLSFRNGLITPNLIDIDNTCLFIGDITEDCLADMYGDLAYKVGETKILHKTMKKSNSLYDALNKEG